MIESFEVCFSEVDVDSDYEFIHKRTGAPVCLVLITYKNRAIERKYILIDQLILTAVMAHAWNYVKYKYIDRNIKDFNIDLFTS